MGKVAARYSFFPPYWFDFMQISPEFHLININFSV